LSQQGGQWPELNLKMGKRGEEHQQLDGSVSGEVDLLKNKLEQMEEVVKKQAADFRSELVSSQVKMLTELKEQLDEFLASILKIHSQTPPPNTKPPNSAASNMGQNIDLQSFFGDNTLPLHPYSYSASPQSFTHPTRTPVTQTHRPSYTPPQMTTPYNQLGSPHV
jgi:hypothetical protein